MEFNADTSPPPKSVTDSRYDRRSRRAMLHRDILTWALLFHSTAEGEVLGTKVNQLDVMVAT